MDIPKLPPTEFDPAELAKLQGINAKKPGVISGASTIDALDRFEEPSPTSGLSQDVAWFSLGLAYVMVGVDRSLFEVYRAAGQEFKLLTHRAPTSLVYVTKSSYHLDPWSATIQGLPKNLAADFADFVTSYQFARNGKQWTLRWVSAHVRDPFRANEFADIHIACPVNLTDRVKLIQIGKLDRSPGAYPVLGAAHVQ